MRWWVTLISVGCLQAAAHSWAAEIAGSAAHPESDPSAETPLFASPTRMDRIGRILVPVLINGRGPFRMLVDTGAAQSTLSPSLVHALGLATTDQRVVRVNGITGTAELPSVSIERLECGDFVIEHAQLPVVLAPIMADADGILGVAGLQRQRLLVDFQHDRVVLGAVRGSLPDFSKVTARRLSGGLLAVAARIGGVKATAIMDTGSERTLGNIALRDALKAKHPAGKEPRLTEVYGATTTVSSGELLLTPPISMGDVTVENVTVVYGDFHIFGVWNLETEPAIIIGMDVLGTTRALAIDFARSAVYFKGFHQGPLEITHGISMLIPATVSPAEPPADARPDPLT